MLRNACQRSRDHMKSPEMEITLFSPKKKDMRNKKWNVKRTNQNIMNIFEMNSIMHRSSQKIIPKHKRYIEQCDIWKNKEYEKTYLRRHSSHTSPDPENLEKSTYMLINGGTRHRDQMKRRENQNKHSTEKHSLKEIRYFSQTIK